MRRCPICGGDSGDRSLYCFQCGAPLVEAAVGGGMPSTVQQAPLPGAGAKPEQAAAVPDIVLPAAQAHPQEGRVAVPDPTVPQGPARIVAAGKRPDGAARLPGTPGDDATAAEPPSEAAGGQGPAAAPGAAMAETAAAPALDAWPPVAPPKAAGPANAAPGTLVDGKYSIERVLGEGGMGVVYLAREIHTEGQVVLKAVRPEIAHRKDVRERTLAEGKALGRIDHTNVVQLKSVVVEGKGLWLVMQYVDGESLEQTLARYATQHKPMPVDEVLRVFRQIVAGVAAAHGEGLIHRDLKPGNILIRRKDGVVKVTDFGIAKVEEDAQAGRGQTKGFIGSPHYTSPEQVTGQRDLDRRVDIYALGIMLYEMLAGRVPFEGDSAFEIMRLQAEAPMPRLSAVRPDLPAALDEVIIQACAKDRAKRFGGCEELLAAIEAALSAAALGATVQAGAPLGAGPAPGPMPAAPVGPSMPTGPSMPMGTPMPAAAYPMPTGGHAYPTGPHRDASYPPGAMPGYGMGTVTGQATALPPHGSGAGIAWILGLLALVVVGIGIGALLVFGVIPLPDLGAKHATGPDTTGRVEDDGGAAPGSSSTASSTAAPRSPLAALEGRWISEAKREFQAVLVSEDTLEFRVVDPSQHNGQPYLKDEARFVLHRLVGSNTEFEVEDRVRPRPPQGCEYDPSASRNSCFAVWTEAEGKPLRATATGDRLSVYFASIDPKSEVNFLLEGKTVTGCRGLKTLPVARTQAYLMRQ